ncbi:cytochrome P450 [Paracoccus xiamenensis]|uniref:cytochrome P450 n=1 Tax=Paracoccus xiamenensis TaxID=2714901 RepID=UPI0014087158|nr:cytochrome P450 [Paracoccus xiamenensis]NHF72536.1 cytochrome P450 [Paracoccus xiamenensis]
MTAPKPASSEGRTGLLHYLRHFRRDLLSALPARLYRAWMAEYRTGPIHSFVCNDPELVSLVLRERPADFPKSNRLREGLAPLLGRSVFVTNGAEWQRQRRIIDPAFEGGRLREIFPQIWDASLAAARRLPQSAEIDLEPVTSHAAADVIFRTLFSLPIEDATAAQVFAAFRAHQDAQPIVNAGALIPLPAWFPRFHSRRTRRTAAHIRGLIARLVAERAARIKDGTAPDDLATKIMTTPDPQTGETFTPPEMVDQVAIFFLAGHETSASALAWALWLLAANPDWQDRVAAESRTAINPENPEFSVISRLNLSRAVFREALRLYPPVPMMVREAACPEQFRDREVPKGAQIVVSPWHLHRHERLWDNPDGFDPARWETENGRACQRRAYIPFSAGARVCPGAGFAMVEGPLMLSLMLRDHRLETTVPPVPVARLTVRGQDGIRVRISPRDPDGSCRR